MQDVALLFSYDHLPSLSPGLLPAQAPLSFTPPWLPHPRPLLAHFLQITPNTISSIPWKLFEIHHQVSWSMGLIKLSGPTSSPLTTFTWIICLFLYPQAAIEEWHLGCEASSLMYHTAEQFVYCIAKISIFATPLCLKETILSSAHYHQT